MVAVRKDRRKTKVLLSRKLQSAERCLVVTVRLLLISLVLAGLVWHGQLLRKANEERQALLLAGDARTQSSLLRLSSSSSSSSTRGRAKKKKETTVAYVITLTDCDVASTKIQGFVDGAAVLAHSIHLQHNNHDNDSRYDYRLYALVHPTAVACATDLPKLNYTVVTKDTPIALSEIRRDEYRDRVTKNGCCGAREFLKLYALTMVQYPIVVLLDADSLLLKPLDPLYDAMRLSAHGSDAQRHHHVPALLRPYVMRPQGWASNETVPIRTDRPIDAYFVHDYYDFRRKTPALYGVQGGFWIVRPDVNQFDALRQLIVAGNFSVGWYDEAEHYPGYFGAPQVQGLLSWYYGHAAAAAAKKQGQPPSSVVNAIELHHCLFNNMAQWAWDDDDRCLVPGVKRWQDCQNCQTTALSEIFSLHFTTCRKPWLCPLHSEWQDGYAPHSQRCNELLPLWYRARYLLERHSWQWDTPHDDFNHLTPLEQHSYGYCRPTYRRIPLDNVTTANHHQAAAVPR